jgi:hypothetical protein
MTMTMTMTTTRWTPVPSRRRALAAQRVQAAPAVPEQIALFRADKARALVEQRPSPPKRTNVA